MDKKQKELIEKAKQDLIETKLIGDIEAEHYKADEILMELLNGLGLTDVVELYKEVPKWYS